MTRSRFYELKESSWRPNVALSFELRCERVMAIRALSEPAFKATFRPPMRQQAAGEAPPVPVKLKEYVDAVIEDLELPTSPAIIEIHHLYVTHDDSFTNVMFTWGVKNVFLAVVVDHQRAAIHGHRLLDINEINGLRCRI